MGALTLVRNGGGGRESVCFAFKLPVPHTSKGCSKEAGGPWFQGFFLPSFSFIVLPYSNLYFGILHKIFILKNGDREEPGVGYL